MNFALLCLTVVSHFGDKQGVVKQLHDFFFSSNYYDNATQNVCSFFADVPPPDLHEQKILLFRETVQLLKKHQIAYVMSSGTLLGMQRHKNGLVPWDDDMDIAVQNKDIARVHQALKQSSNLAVVKFWGGYKSFFKNASRSKHKYPWRYPFLDIFDRQHLKLSKGFLKLIPDHEIWGKQTAMWNGIKVPVPNDITAILTGSFGSSWKTQCTSTCWDHVTEKGKKCITRSCKEVQSCAPVSYTHLRAHET